ncbi:hypothetical protein F5X99DRAFT_207827 [Biscogniauxia marginata]|nr:hypothetical protein F5X99DRAFT_207827 [Biscogniauxia marginata]
MSAKNKPVCSESAKEPGAKSDEENSTYENAETSDITGNPSTKAPEDNTTMDIIHLPNELLLEIMENLSHPDDLESLLSSHRQFRELFNTFSTSILQNLSKLLVPGCETEALKVLWFPLRSRGESRDSLRQRINNYQNESQSDKLQWPKTLREYRGY